jgi:ABC-type antimicrobial peptide transport system permease subunit
MKDALVMTIAGAVVGIGAAWGLTRLMESMLFGLKPRDPSTMTIAIVVLLAVATVAAAIPAWRASQTDPLKALRESAS